MKVYVLFEIHYGGYECGHSYNVVGVFSSRSNAEEFLQNIKPDMYNNLEYEIEEKDIDPNVSIAKFRELW